MTSIDNLVNNISCNSTWFSCLCSVNFDIEYGQSMNIDFINIAYLYNYSIKEIEKMIPKCDFEESLVTNM